MWVGNFKVGGEGKKKKEIDFERGEIERGMKKGIV